MGKKHDKVEINIVMTGDVLMHDTLIESGRSDDGSYFYDQFFENILPDIDAADIRIVNQETIIGGEELGLSGYPVFNSPYEIGDAESKAGFNIVLHATNHALDKGFIGIENCLNYWKTRHPEMAVLGIYRSRDVQDDVFVFDKEGFRIAILNYTFESNVVPAAEDRGYRLGLFDKEKMHQDISKAKLLADMVVVCPHWGTEYLCTPDTNQQEWMRFLLSEGVDIVIGTHPHVLQPVQLVSDGEGKNMLVYYSLGNFVSNQEGIPRNIGGLAKIKLVKDQYGSRIENYELVPVICHREVGLSKIKAYELRDYTDDLADKNDIKAVDGHTDLSVQYIYDFCHDVLGHSEYAHLICQKK